MRSHSSASVGAKVVSTCCKDVLLTAITSSLKRTQPRPRLAKLGKVHCSHMSRFTTFGITLWRKHSDLTICTQRISPKVKWNWTLMLDQTHLTSIMRNTPTIFEQTTHWQQRRGHICHHKPFSKSGWTKFDICYSGIMECDGIALRINILRNDAGSTDPSAPKSKTISVSASPPEWWTARIWSQSHVSTVEMQAMSMSSENVHESSKSE